MALVHDKARDEAARRWFGYGRWAAPYWFVGMEPGGTDEHASYESWVSLGESALIDCRDHHEDSNRRAGKTVTKWHQPVPPVQKTWGALIRVVLAFEGRAGGDDEVAVYQRDHWGRLSGNTAALEISALHARHTSVDVERTIHRTERLIELKRQLEANQPTFALFYGVSYRNEYEAIAGPFNADGWRWSGKTLCVLTTHPAPSRRPPPPVAYWRALGGWMQHTAAAGPGVPCGPIPKPDPPSRPPTRRKVAPPPASSPAALAHDGSSIGFDPYDPKHTIEILQHLNHRHAFDDRHFRQLHHFGARASIQEHIDYCRARRRFVALTNATVAQRLHRVLGYLDAGQRMEQALQLAVIDLPIPR